MKLLVASIVSLVLIGCSGTGPPTPSPSGACGSDAPASAVTPCTGRTAAPSIGGSGTATAASSSSPFAGTPTTVRLALDWTPNTDHTAFYVARHEGWYRDAGIDLQILPYATAAPETLLAAHQAECGISFQDSLTFAVAKRADIVSVAAILQKTASAIGVLASSSIARPKDLDGKTYAGFGYPNEVPTLKAV